jgi:hypothetical protein
VIRTLRIRRGVIQTPVVTYRKGHQVVTVTATCHAGTAAYYKDLYAAITRLESQGAVVLYEMTVSAPDDQWATATDEERRARDTMNSDKDEQDRIWGLVTSNLGWSTQRDLPYPPSWRNADLTDLEVIRRAGPDTVATALGRSTAGGRVDDHARAERFQAIMGIMFRVEAALPALARRIVASAESEAARRLARVIVNDRDDRVLGMIPGDADAVLVWGYGHLASMDVALQAAGFSHAGEVWLDVGKVPSPRGRPR